MEGPRAIQTSTETQRDPGASSRIIIEAKQVPKKSTFEYRVGGRGANRIRGRVPKINGRQREMERGGGEEIDREREGER